MKPLESENLKEASMTTSNPAQTKLLVPSSDALTVRDEHALPSPNDFEAYARAVQQWPVLDEAEERRLAHAWYHDHDRDAARKLVLAHLRLVVKVVRAHRGYRANPADLVQEGNIGLMKAVKRFNPEHGSRLASYAVLWIEAEIRDYLINHWRVVKIGSSAAMKKLFFGYRKTLAALWQAQDVDQDAPSTTAEIARRLSVSEADVRAAEAYFRGQDTAWDLDEGDEVPVTPVEHAVLAHLARDDAPRHQEDPANLVERALDDQRASDAMRDALNGLSERERAILTARRLTDPPVGLSELAQIWSISIERVRQLEQQALARLRARTLEKLAPTTKKAIEDA